MTQRIDGISAPLWKRMLKWLAWLVGGTLALAVVAYLALLAINWRDVPPSDSARRLEALYRNRPAVADADNGYVYVMGFSVAADADPQAAGLRRLAWVRRIIPLGQFPLTGDPVTGDGAFRSRRSESVRQVTEACNAGSGKCAVALEHEDALREWVRDEKWLLDRYKTLLHRRGWLETAPLDVRAPSPAYGAVLDGQKLLLAQAYVFAKENNPAAVRELLGDDVRFWRHVLASSDILITKMIAVAALHRHFSIGNLVLRRLPPEVELQAVPEGWKAPMTEEERSLLRTFTGEWIFGNGIIQDAQRAASWGALLEFNTDERLIDKLTARLLAPLFQLQDTNNRRAEVFIRAAERMSVPLEELPVGVEQAQAIFDQHGAGKGAFTRLYNPVGDLVLAVATIGFTPYGARVADVEGSRRAAVLAADLRSRRVDVQKMTAELAASDIRAPYDGKPFQWDVGEQAIVFVGLEQGERGRRAFKY
jgi:hypothetical protein